MNDISFYLFPLITIFLVIFLWFRKTITKKEGKLLPGPPLIEGLRVFMKGMLNNTLHLYLSDWVEKYGDVMQVNLLVKKVVFINEADVFRRLVKDKDSRDFTNDRPPNFFGEFIHGGDFNIFNVPFGPDLQEKRRIFHNVLKFYGEGRGQFEELVVTSLTELTDKMKKNGNKIEFSIIIRNYIITLLGFLITGDISEVSQNNFGKLKRFSDCMDKLFLFEVDYLLHTIPFLRHIPGLRYKKLCDTASKVKEQFHETFFYAMKKTYNPAQKRGIVDELLSIQQEMGKDGFPDDATIKGITCDIIQAGYLTSSSTLTSLFLFLIKHQDIQSRVYEEIKVVIGDSIPSFKHRQIMPYTEAAIQETLRLTSNVPLLAAHVASNDIVFDGYSIPKSSILFMNAWHNHHREDFWEDPWTFRPERFLNSNGQLLENDNLIRQNMIAFGTGRRGCPGETFGKFRAFLVATFLLQKFRFVPDEQEPLPSIDPRDWKGKTVLSPENYKCKIIPRSG